MNTSTPTNKRKVFIITDSYDDLVYQKFLPIDGNVKYRQNCYQIQPITSYLEALDICLNQTPDCVLLDWDLPHLDGVEFLEKLSNTQIPVIILLSADREELVAAIAPIYQDYLVKETLSKELIFTTIRNEIAQSHLKQQIAATAKQLQESQAHKFSGTPFLNEEILSEHEYFHILADHAPVMIWRSGIDKSCYYFNKPWLDYTGRTLEQEIGDGWIEGIYPDDRQVSLDIYFQAFDAREPFTIEYRLKRYDQSYGWIIDRGMPMFSKDNIFLGYIGSCIDITAYKQTEIELQNNLKFIQKITNASPNILYLYDLQEKRNIYSNREIAKILGYSTEQIQAMKDNLFQNLIYPEDLAAVESHFNLLSHARDEDILEIEYRVINTNGDIKWLRSYDTIFSRDDSGKVRQIIGNAQDISINKQMELELQERKLFIQQIADASPSMLFLYNVQEMKLVYINKTIHSLLGYTPADVASMGEDFFPKTLHPEEFDYSKYLEQINNAKDGEIIRHEYRIKHANGEWRWLHSCSVILSRDKHGKVLLMTGMAYDISDRKKIELELEESQRFIKQITDASPGVIYLFNVQEQRNIYANKKLRSVLGYTPEEIQEMGANFFPNLIHPEDMDIYVQYFQRINAAADGETIQSEYRMKHANGQWRWLYTLDTVFSRDESGKVLLTTGVANDITDRKIVEAELLASEQRFSRIASSFPGIIYTTIQRPDGSHYFEYISSRVKEIYELDAEKVLQSPKWTDDRHHPDDREGFVAAANYSVATMSPFNHEWRIVTPSGKIKWLQASSLPERIENLDVPLFKRQNGDIARHGIMLDITELKLAESRLLEQTAQQSLLSTITQRIRSSLQLEEILSITVAEIHKVFHGDRTLIYQILENRTRLVIAESVSAPWRSMLNTIVWDNILLEDIYAEYLQGNLCILHGESASALELKITSLDNEYISSPPIRAKLAMPIINDNKLWGLICIHQYSCCRYWQEWEIDLMRQLSSQFAIIFQQATLHQQVQIELASKEILYQQLENELQQKKVLLKEVHHRVKNNLQVMSSLLRMQFRKTTPEVKILIEEYQNRIQSMALIHAQLYRNDDLEQINFRNYISDLLVNLFQCYGKSPTLIQYTLDVSDISLPLDRSISLGLIINELISNALKYAFPKDIGKINIKLTQNEQQYHLIVADNGIGIPNNIILENTDGLGMQLVYSLVEQLEGIFIHNRKEGTEFQVFFPIL